MDDALKMLTQRSHIAVKRGVYFYRRRLPSPHRGDIAVSLRTKGFREAQHLATPPPSPI